MRRLAGVGVALIGVAALGAGLAYGQTPETDTRDAARRDAALARIAACNRRNEASNRECKYFNEDVATVVEVYRSGDKTVLPTLFQFTYLTDFYDEALLADPDGFLTAMANLPANRQQAVAAGIGGGPILWQHNVERFRAIRDLLESVPDTSPTKAVADVCLKIVEAEDAWLFVNYFPPETFQSRAANFHIAWFSRDMFELGDKPLWQSPVGNERTFRLTYLGSFNGEKGVTLSVLADGSGQATVGVRHPFDAKTDEKHLTVSESRVAGFLERVDRASFWTMPTESSPSTWIGFDGAVWILEGVKDGRYHIVDRWCPGTYKPSREDAAFAEAGRFLLWLAGEKHRGGC